jgi:hypothetical protein
LTVEDEIDFWRRARKQPIVDALEPIATDLAKIKAARLEEVEEIVDGMFSALDDLWKQEDVEYPQERMTHLLEIIGNNQTEFIFSTISIFIL